MNNLVENYPSTRLLNDSLAFVSVCTGKTYLLGRS